MSNEKLNQSHVDQPCITKRLVQNFKSRGPIEESPLEPVTRLRRPVYQNARTTNSDMVLVERG